MIYTVFPNDESYPPQDFPTYKDAEDYGNEEFGKGRYAISSTSGECV